MISDFDVLMARFGPPMPIEDAWAFLATHGNLGNDVKRLKSYPFGPDELAAALSHAIKNGQPKIIALAASVAIIKAMPDSRMPSWHKETKQRDEEQQAERALAVRTEAWKMMKPDLNFMVELFPGGKTPSRATGHSAGFDCFANINTSIRPGEHALVPLGFNGTFNPEYVCLLLDKSGLAAKHGMTRRAGVIDADYPEQWMALMVNEGQDIFNIYQGMKIVQAVFVLHASDAGVEVVPSIQPFLPDAATQRRTGGFGSTGEK